jgi:hypothetical protein
MDRDSLRASNARRLQVSTSEAYPEGRGVCGTAYRARQASLRLRGIEAAAHQVDPRRLDTFFVLEHESRQIVALDGSVARHVDDLIHPFGNGVDWLDWSPDGRRLALSGAWVGCEARRPDPLLEPGPQDTLCLGIVDPEGKSEPATIAPPAAVEPDLHAKLFWPKFSPDGARISVLGNLIDFTSEPVVDETFTLYDYEPATARFTEVLSETHSMILDPSGAVQPTGPGTQELSFGTTVVWAPDGRSLLYVAREGSDADAIGTIRSIDASGGSRSVVLVRDVRSFDVGFIDD